MQELVLVTGGAGFIGSYIVDELVRRGYRVRVLDNLDPQVHGDNANVPEYLNEGAEFINGDVRNPDDVRKAIDGVEIIFHEAAVVGVGQSMYEIKKYMDVNTLGTANLLEQIIKCKGKIKKLIVASSMSIYGEGGYECSKCGRISPKLRPTSQLEKRQWEMECHICGEHAKPIPTNEEKPLNSTSIYAISKKDQEEMCLCIGRAYNIPTVALRYFNTYGPRQALSNPYTGVAAIFSSRLLNDHTPIIYEDGLQSRDFVHVKDIVQANMLAMESGNANYEMFNVGTGRRLSILDIANALISRLNFSKLNFKGKSEITYQFREGDIRHCYADISKIKEKLKYSSKHKFEDGIEELVHWVKEQHAEDRVEQARKELENRCLTK
ncbi:SDR family NAD(P)-dependent oxidoreductase [bacterium]|nr:SDR family NAD(P)-dependent oxidoreductase [bacterium]